MTAHRRGVVHDLLIWRAHRRGASVEIIAIADHSSRDVVEKTIERVVRRRWFYRLLDLLVS